MKDKILASLKRLNIEEYIINVTSCKSAQMFFVKKSLDSKRAENTKTYNVNVYRSFDKNGKKMKGNSSVYVYNGMTDEEMDASLSRAYLAASFVCNPTYDLMECTENKFVKMESNLLKSAAKRLLKHCLQKIKEKTYLSIQLKYSLMKQTSRSYHQPALNPGTSREPSAVNLWHSAKNLRT